MGKRALMAETALTLKSQLYRSGFNDPLVNMRMKQKLDKSH